MMGKTRTYLMQVRALRDFLRLESASGILLFIASFLALLVDNSPVSSFYNWILHTPIELKIGHWMIVKPLLFWINEGLMSLFFLLIGLELKEELLEGVLSKRTQATL